MFLQRICLFLVKVYKKIWFVSGELLYVTLEVFSI